MRLTQKQEHVLQNWLTLTREEIEALRREDPFAYRLVTLAASNASIVIRRLKENAA
jgi:hypothetical protein